jgi:two-component system, chemotaxis family, response regulator WspF
MSPALMITAFESQTETGMRSRPGTGRPGRRVHAAPSQLNLDTLILLGASAGGPTALAEILGHLPSDFPAAIIVIQHIDPQFATSLANWLDSQSSLRIKLARPNDCPQPGVVLVAGRNAHLVFTNPQRLAYVLQPNDSVYCPSIDVLFRSAERFWNGIIIGVLLTGIGRDGAEGLHSLRIAGHHTMAQDATSSVIYGMPKAAAKLGAATEILPLKQIAPRLIQLVAHATSLHA